MFIISERDGLGLIIIIMAANLIKLPASTPYKIFLFPNEKSGGKKKREREKDVVDVC